MVLTDSVCLIPGGEPVVRLEDAPGNARREAQRTAHVVEINTAQMGRLSGVETIPTGISGSALWGMNMGIFREWKSILTLWL